MMTAELRLHDEVEKEMEYIDKIMYVRFYYPQYGKNGFMVMVYKPYLPENTTYERLKKEIDDYMAKFHCRLKERRGMMRFRKGVYHLF